VLWASLCAFLHLSEDDTNLTADEVCDLLKDMRLKDRSLYIHPKNQKEKPTALAQTSDIQTEEFLVEKEQNKVDASSSQIEGQVVPLGEQMCLPEMQHKKSPCSESNDQIEGGNKEILKQIKSSKKSSKNESTSSSPSRIIIPSIIQKLVDHSVHRSKKKKTIETVETTPPKSNQTLFESPTGFNIAPVLNNC
jgi:hypothetical protein